jgi:hypothetical protein
MREWVMMAFGSNDEADSETDFDPSTEIFVMLPLLVKTGRAAKANVSVDAGTVAAINSAAALRRMTRSAFMVAAAR